MQLVGGQPRNLTEVEVLNQDETLTVARTLLSACKYNSDKDLLDFAQLLGGIPLAVTQACAYIEANKLMNVTDYVKKFNETQETQEDLLGKSSYDLRRDPDIPNAVLLTWHMSFEHICSINRLAAHLLSFMSILDTQAIPMLILHSFKAQEL